MPALVCGSLAFDSIATFGGRFADQIMPNQLHVLNVSFLVPSLRREFGGCAGNIAYNLAALGGEPIIVAAVGADGGDYLARLRSFWRCRRRITIATSWRRAGRRCVRSSPPGAAPPIAGSRRRAGSTR